MLITQTPYEFILANGLFARIRLEHLVYFCCHSCCWQFSFCNRQIPVHMMHIFLILIWLFQLDTNRIYQLWVWLYLFRLRFVLRYTFIGWSNVLSLFNCMCTRACVCVFTWSFIYTWLCFVYNSSARAQHQNQNGLHVRNGYLYLICSCFSFCLLLLLLFFYFIWNVSV